MIRSTVKHPVKIGITLNLNPVHPATDSKKDIEAADRVDMFMNRIANFEDRSHMPEFLGGLLAHEIAHMLQGVARHSRTGVMKAPWTERDLEALVKGALPFAPEDVTLIQARFGGRMVVAAKVTK